MVLMSMAVMVPFTPWSTMFDGTINGCAFFSDHLSGRYILVLALAGLVILSGRLKMSWSAATRTMTGLGLGMIALTVIDGVLMAKAAEERFSMIDVHPGVGMALSVVIGVFIVAAALLPERKAPMVDAVELRRGSRD